MSHPIDNAGLPADDHGLEKQLGTLHVDPQHLHDLAAELRDLQQYLATEGQKHVNEIRHLSTVTGGKDNHEGGAVADWTNPAGRFGDADTLWTGYQGVSTAVAQFVNTLSGQLTAYASAADTIADRHQNTEERNALNAQDVDKLLQSNTGTSTAADTQVTGGASQQQSGQGSGQGSTAGPSGQQAGTGVGYSGGK